MLPLMFRLIQSAQKRWQRIQGFNFLGDWLVGVSFKDCSDRNVNRIVFECIENGNLLAEVSPIPTIRIS